MKGKFYIPKKKLSGLVNLIWEQDSNERNKWKIVPSGYVELIFRIQSNFTVDKNKIHLKQTTPVEKFCFLSGIHTKPLYINFNRFNLIGVQLHPIAAKSLFGIPVSKLRDSAVEGELIIDELNYWEDVLKSGHTFYEKARRLENYICTKIDETPDMYRAMKLSKLINKLLQKRIKGESIDWQSHTGYSRTQTYRLFKEWYGLSPTNLMQLYQFVQATNELHPSPDSLKNIAFNTGYFDQSHFIRTFKDFAEMTPGDYRKNRTELLGQLSY